MKMQGIIS